MFIAAGVTSGDILLLMIILNKDSLSALFAGITTRRSYCSSSLENSLIAWIIMCHWFVVKPKFQVGVQIMRYHITLTCRVGSTSPLDRIGWYHGSSLVVIDMLWNQDYVNNEILYIYKMQGPGRSQLLPSTELADIMDHR